MLLHSKNGITIFGDHLKAADIHAQLCELPNMTRDEASQLLDPADKQNVPKAVKLLQLLLEQSHWIWKLSLPELDIRSQ